MEDADLNGAQDHQIFAAAQELDAVLVTADLDFGNILRFPLATHSGIVVLRLRRLLPHALLERVLSAIEYEMLKDLRGSLVIVD
jgi:predicted nuclease of predicted toxin-antitoxin system